MIELQDGYKAKNFSVQEFVTRDAFNQLKGSAIHLINPKIIKIAQELRTLLGKPVKINDWHSGGQYNYSGFRPLFARVGARASKHKLGWAIDIKVKGMKPSEVAKVILENKKMFYDLGLRRMESPLHTPTWLHLDIYPTTLKGDIKIFNP